MHVGRQWQELGVQPAISAQPGFHIYPHYTYSACHSHGTTHDGIPSLTTALMLLQALTVGIQPEAEGRLVALNPQCLAHPIHYDPFMYCKRKKQNPVSSSH